MIPDIALTRVGVADLALVFSSTFSLYLLLSPFALKFKMDIVWRRATVYIVTGGAIVIVLGAMYPEGMANLIPRFQAVNSSKANAALASLGAIAGVVVAELMVRRLGRALDRVVVGLSGNHLSATAQPWLGFVGTTSVATASLVAIVLSQAWLRAPESGSTPVPGPSVSATSSVSEPSTPETDEIQTAVPSDLRAEFRDLDPSLKVRAVYDLPGHPISMVFVTPTSGYIALVHGEVVRFQITGTEASDIELFTVVDDLMQARGIAVVGTTLFVSEVTSLPCSKPAKPAFGICTGRHFMSQFEDSPAPAISAGELIILTESWGRLYAYKISTDGSPYRDKRIVIDNLPVANSHHAVNGLRTGPDGYVYLSIGNVDRVAYYGLPVDDLFADIQGPNLDLLGTILRIEPDTGEYEVFARGLRNVYHVTFDDEGRLWAVDNDGPSALGWKYEEVLQIKEGEHYGFPYEGTFDSHEVRTDQPYMIIDAFGSSGVSWARDPLGGDAQGMLLASCGTLKFLQITELSTWQELEIGNRVKDLALLLGCPSAVESITESVFAIALFTSQKLAILESK